VTARWPGWPSGSGHGHGLPLPVGLSVALAVMLVNHVGTLRAALNRGGRGRGGAGPGQ